MRSHKGFSLIELLIVVAIIMVLAAVAIPKMLAARMAANEASAVACVRGILTAQAWYTAAYPKVGYASDLKQLGMPSGGGATDSSHAGYLDWVLGCETQPCPKSGYKFSITSTAASDTTVGTFTITAVPIYPGSSGSRGFCADQTGVIMVDPDGGSTCTQPLAKN